MNRKLAYGIVLAGVISAFNVFAGDEASAKTEGKSIEERLAALEGASKKSGWAEKVTIKGDFRYRYEYKAKDNDTNKDRHRIRARIGAYAKVNNQVRAGIRIASGEEKPTSTNQTIKDDFDNKEIWLDLAYITIECEKVDGLSATFGKMKQPWKRVSDLIFDSDVNPEGISSSYEFGNDEVSLTSTIAYHILGEKGDGEEDNLTSGQIAAETKIAEDVKLTTGVGAYYYSELDFEIIDGFVKFDIKKGPLPFKVYGEYLNNTASGVNEDAAWIVGVGSKCPVTGVKFEYNYRDLELNSVNDALDDGDFGGPDGKGHKLKAKYGLAKNTSVGATYFRVDDGGVDVDLLQVDFAVKF